MGDRRRLLTLLGAGHLVVVICGAAYLLPEQSTSGIGKTVEWYGRMSGADSQYGFFAPEVTALYRSRFILQDERGATWSDSLEQAKSPEVALRLEGVVERAFSNGAAEESAERRERLVKSWAAVMFTRHLRAVSLLVAVEVFDVPTMAEYRGGDRPEWKALYTARVEREPTGRIQP